MLANTGPEIKTKFCTKKMISASAPDPKIEILYRNRTHVACHAEPDQLGEIFPRRRVVEGDTGAETETGGNHPNRVAVITQTEIRNFDRFLDAHPQIRADLQKNPVLVNGSGYLQQHTDLKVPKHLARVVKEKERMSPRA